MEVQEIIENRDNREFVLKAVKENGKFLDFVAETFKDDKEVVKMALEQDSEALEFVSERLKDDKEIVAIGIKGAP